MHRFLSQIEHFPEVNRLMGVPYAAAEVAPENLGLAPHSRSFDPQNDMRIKDQNSFIADEPQSGFAVGDGTGGCSGHGGSERIEWQSNGDEAAFGSIIRVGGCHGDLDCGGAHRDIDDDRIVIEIDFMAAAVRAAQDSEHEVSSVGCEIPGWKDPYWVSATSSILCRPARAGGATKARRAAARRQPMTRKIHSFNSRRRPANRSVPMSMFRKN